MNYFAQSSPTEETINTTLEYIPPVEPKNDKAFTPLTIGIGVVLVLVIVGIGIVIVRKRRKPAQKTQDIASPPANPGGPTDLPQ